MAAAHPDFRVVESKTGDLLELQVGPEWDVVECHMLLDTYSTTDRMVVPGGWLYRVRVYRMRDRRAETGHMSVVFVPGVPHA